jgi:hypothetical protein
VQRVRRVLAGIDRRAVCEDLDGTRIPVRQYRDAQDSTVARVGRIEVVAAAVERQVIDADWREAAGLE